MCQRISSGYYAVCAMIVCIVVAPYDKSQKDWQANAGSYDRCPGCGGWKAKKAYRCRSCTPRYLEAGERRWNPTATHTAARNRARVRFPSPTSCERCGREDRIERHHKDGDPLNNDRQNIAMLCRRCHMEVDGRMDALVDVAMSNAQRARKPPSPCSECGRLYKPLRRGLCHNCNERKRRRERKKVSFPSDAS